MIPAPHITDHALLRWMERVHGVDVEGFRDLMRAEIRQALDAYNGQREPGSAAFIITQTGECVITVLAADQEPGRMHRGSVAVSRACI